MGIMTSNFTTEARIQLNIICSRVSPSSNVTDVPSLQARMIACILDGILLNVGHYIIHELKEYLYQDSPTLMFSSLIIELCR